MTLVLLIAPFLLFAAPLSLINVLFRRYPVTPQVRRHTQVSGALFSLLVPCNLAIFVVGDRLVRHVLVGLSFLLIAAHLVAYRQMRRAVGPGPGGSGVNEGGSNSVAQPERRGSPR